jgi:hypothetical protein
VKAADPYRDEFVVDRIVGLLSADNRPMTIREIAAWIDAEPSIVAGNLGLMRAREEVVRQPTDRDGIFVYQLPAA